jgi:spore coat polysaccharide biosynthesis predicted glycosyltransferase SpsG
MRIAIRADSGVNIGMGHVMRCKAIANEAELHGHFIRFFDNLDVDTFVNEAANVGADCVLIDSYIWTEQCYKKVTNKFASVVIDDNARLNYSADLLINANLYAADLNYSGCDVKTKLLGGRYTILRDEFRNTAPSEFRQTVKRILVTMGGADINNYTSVVLEGLTEIQGVEIVVIAGPLMRCVDKINNYGASVIHSPNNMAEIINSCDIAVSSAGSTVYELCAMGVPSVLIQQADNQSRICDYFTKTGHMNVLGNYNDVEQIYISDTIKKLTNNSELRKQMRENLLNLVERGGVSNIVEAIEGLV